MSLPTVLRLISRIPILQGSAIALSFTAFVIYLLSIAGAEITWRSAVEIFFLGLVLWMTGEIVFQGFNLHNGLVRVPLTVILGTVIVSLIATSGLILKTQALVIFEIYSLITISFFCISKFLISKPRSKEIPVSGSMVDLCVPAVLFALVAFWSADLARTLPILKATYNLNAWSDYYIHATEISQLGSVFPPVAAPYCLPVNRYLFITTRSWE